MWEWNNGKWIYGCVLHMDIKNGKAWLQYDGTEDEMADELIKARIPEKYIVIGFHKPYKLKFTKFAAA